MNTEFSKKVETKEIRIALFCGGRGSASIINELLRWPSIHLTLIVNAYDDGLSTGTLRQYISSMLGPSDFRKNLSYLLSPFSQGQYALKELLEFRLPNTITPEDIRNFTLFLETTQSHRLLLPLKKLFHPLEPHLLTRIRVLLLNFFSYAESLNQPFDFRDCALGNLIFAGAYLTTKNFNQAAKEMSALVSSRALLVNASEGDNRILIGLKEDGTLLARESEIIDTQSAIPIRSIFLVKQVPSQTAWEKLAGKTIAEKESFLQSHEALPAISQEAALALKTADIILYGPGTQHSSLFPSYKITHQALKSACAPIKVFIVNLEHDYDIQSLCAHEIVDRALTYMQDPENESAVLTHILLDNTILERRLENQKLCAQTIYKKSNVLSKKLANDLNNLNKKIHNGRVVVETILAMFEKTLFKNACTLPHLDIFIDIYKRSSALQALSQEFLELDWKLKFSNVNVTINQAEKTISFFPGARTIQSDGKKISFPDVKYFFEWLSEKKSEYLVLITGDGEYRFRDVMLGIQLLEQSHFGAVFGSRNQSRQQFKDSRKAAYGEKKILSFLSFAGAFLMSAHFALRFGIIFSDPLTGLRIFKLSKLIHLADNIHLPLMNHATPTTITKYLIKNKIEIAELPVSYQTFSGFTDPHWRIRRGIKNLWSMFKGIPS